MLHVLTTGPAGWALAFEQQTPACRLSSHSFTSGSRKEIPPGLVLTQSSLGSPCQGYNQSTSYKLNAGFISASAPQGPVLLTPIESVTLTESEQYSDAFDLDDHFKSHEGQSLSYTVSGNDKIEVSIDPVTHLVSFRPEPGWHGTETAVFTATDTLGNIMPSNEVTLEVRNTENAPEISIIEITPENPKETDVVTLIIKARDADRDDLTFTISDYFEKVEPWQDQQRSLAVPTGNVLPLNPFDSSARGRMRGTKVTQSTP